MQDEGCPALQILTIDEAAKLLKISEATVRRLQQRRLIRFIKVGRSVRFTRSDLVAYLEKQRVDPITL